MLSISKSIKGAGQGEYYLNLAATDDYYLETDREAPGFWLGEGARLLGLQGLLKPDDFRHLLRGYSPDGTVSLVRNITSRRRAGWDLTWSAPKSVSVAWSQAEPETRMEFEAAMRCAAALGVAYLEGVGVVSRQGENGVLKSKASLVFAAFPHSTSRAQDPQLHIHTSFLILECARTEQPEHWNRGRFFGISLLPVLYFGPSLPINWNGGLDFEP